MLRKLSNIFSVLVFIGFIAAGTANSWAWTRHNLINYYVLSGINWLEKYDQITVTPYTYQDQSLNRNFKILYNNPDPTQISPPTNLFVYYTPDSKEKPGFKGAKIGQKTSAGQILLDYSDEPDWGMDKELDLSFAQYFMGGSQGFRHMYYPAWDWHLPYLFFPQGKAPERAEHFYGMAKQAIKRGDLYWTFRFLARVLHYVEDMGQPYHTSQTSLRFISISSPIQGTIQTTENYHFTYESYVNYRLQQETGGLIPLSYVNVLENAPEFKVSNLTQLFARMARISNEKSEDTFRASIKLFGHFLHLSPKVALSQNNVDSLMNHPQRDQFDRRVHEALKLTGSGARGFLEYVRQKFSL